MAQWYVKDLSKLTHVTVQTLHHYDRIGLLTPSIRLPNGYRLYSEKDLLKLQQIIALKYFGFELAQIKMVLSGDVDVLDYFWVQSRFLEEKATGLLEASHILKKILSSCSRDKSIPWETMIELIEVYRMIEQLENKWIGAVLNSTELKEYVNFEQELKSRFSPQEKQAMEQEWAMIVRDVNDHLAMAPTSQSAIDIGQRCMDWVNRMYSKKHVSLRVAIWEKAFKNGHGSEEHGLSKAAVQWLDQAIYAYYRNCMMSTFNKITACPHEEVLASWEGLLFNMYGDEQFLKKQFIDAVLQDDTISETVKNWLKQTSQK